MPNPATNTNTNANADAPLIVVPGGSGFLGRSLTPFLLDRGYRVAILSRSPRPGDLTDDRVAWHVWDDAGVGDWAACLDGAAAVVNLVGKSVDCRKTPEHVREILESRVASCRVLGEAMRRVEAAGGRAPPVWVQSGTAHIVGDPLPLDRVCDESTPPGPMDEMAPRVGVAWEEAFDAARLPEQRSVVLRISFVIGRANPGGGGAMARLIPLTRWGLGGRVGDGRQWVSWLHTHDLNRLILAAIEDARYRGVYMATAPHPVTNAQFMRALRKVHGRPWSPPAPAWGVRLVSRLLMDTDPDLALKGRRCVPTRLLQEAGFEFEFAQVDDALEAMVESRRGIEELEQS